MTASHCRVASRSQRARHQITQALEWPDQELLNTVQENFPDAGVADAEEARVRTKLLSSEAVVEIARETAPNINITLSQVFTGSSYHTDRYPS